MSSARIEKGVPTLDQVSAGGVVYRTGDPGVEIIIVEMVPELRWQLPKGIIDKGETNEQAALREVREETGTDAKLIKLIETIEYCFFANRNGTRTRYHKFVHFFLMSYESGDVADHDDEVAEARWVSVEEALRMLEFKSERDVVNKADAMIRDSAAFT